MVSHRRHNYYRLALSILALGLLGLGSYQLLKKNIAQNKAQTSQDAVHQLGTLIAAQVETQQSLLNRIQTSPPLVATLKSRSQTKRKQHLKALGALFAPGAVLQHQRPNQSIAMNSLVNRIILHTSSAPVLHLHLDAAQLLDSAWQQLGQPGYAELYSATHTGQRVVANSGEHDLKDTAQALTMKIANTKLSIGYWPSKRISAQPSNLRNTLAAIFSVIALLLLLGDRILFNFTARALHHDIKLVARMFKDIRDGRLHRNYPIQLDEFRHLLNYIARSGGKLVRERRKLQDLGLTDHLSQLPNRRAFEDRLEQLFIQSGTGFAMSVLMIDIDYFKQVNDSYGHDAGDALIVKFAAALKEAIRDTDFVARLGGDEFCIIFPYTELETASGLADRLRRKLPKTLELKPGATHILRWTGGLSAMETHDATYDEVLWRADQALLEAKEAGRNRVYLYTRDSVPQRA
ncbi:MAG TPA: GGDEF domain-containing protein [Acidiferrobacteraceae bacterium]|nr:GGDEF domain-containing protein [Acidiferrobacteraceae bacterium]